MLSNTSDIASTLRGFSWWDDAMAALESAYSAHGEAVRERALEHGNKYAGRRAAMVFDVVASRQRNYQARVLPMVEDWEQRGVSLGQLADEGPGDGLGLRKGEALTMQEVARGLVRFATDHELDDEVGVKTWAEAVEALAHAPKLDPYVGCVKGIGPALFAYLRMRCGASALKPDLRVGRALRSYGFKVSDDVHELLIVSAVVADELTVSRLELDQLLWWGGPQA